jgi:septal ring factor EnvC (AmiA/AmiB activator)
MVPCSSRRLVVAALLRACRVAAALLPLLPAGPALAQDAQKEHADRLTELALVRQEMTAAGERRADLAAEIARIDADRAAIAKSLVASAARARELGIAAGKSEKRLARLGVEEAGIRASLAGRRETLAEVLAALQRLGRAPAPPLIVAPGDALRAVRSAILLGAVVPEIEAEARVLAGELARLAELGAEIAAERENLKLQLAGLAKEDVRLASLLEEKKNFSVTARKDIAAQGARIAELAARAGSLSRLIETMEREIAAAREVAEQAKRAEAAGRTAAEKRLAAARGESAADPVRLTPAMDFEAARGRLALPVAGERLSEWGDKKADGEIAEGLAIRARPGAHVQSPVDGWIVYAGPFRSYGQLLIVNAGNGYHVLLAGMERIDAETGQFVLAGEPVGAMGAQRVASADGNASSAKLELGGPVLYIEFRKDGKSVDPSPWWAATETARGANDS